MSRRRLTTRLRAVERHQGRGPWPPQVDWIEDVRPGEEGQWDQARGAGAAMRAIVLEEIATPRASDALPIITTSVVTDGEGVAEAAGRRWWFALADDGSGGTTATVTGREAALWAGSRDGWGNWGRGSRSLPDASAVMGGRSRASPRRTTSYPGRRSVAAAGEARARCGGSWV
ncbi:MAG: hypothetical protein M3R02_11050 [Chloroflexota bacterium]|nr:hypothetical protein [Chloroflexota bacterium]